MENTLVSVVVVTYNSSETIIETLESIKDQSYENIELIITDDCSKDNTIKLCEKWILKNRRRFYNVQLITSKENTGVSANCNRGNLSTKGEWIKEIAGDDVLLPNCIEENIKFINNNKNINIVFSKCIRFKSYNKKRILGEEIPLEKGKQILNSDAQTQLAYLCDHNFLPAASFFIRAAYFKSSPYDEKYRNLEDYPYWFKCTKKGEKLYYFDVPTVLYRECESLSQSKKTFVNKRLLLDLKLFYYSEIFKELKEVNNEQLLQKTLKDRFVEDFCYYVLKNKNNYFTRKIKTIFEFLFI